MARTERLARRTTEGGKQISALLNADEAALLKRCQDKTGQGLKATLVAGLRALERKNDLSKAELLAEIERRLK